MAAQSQSSKAKAKPDKAARKEAKLLKRAESKQRRRQIFQAFNMQRKQDKALIPIMVGAFLLCTALASWLCSQYEFHVKTPEKQ